MLVGGKLPGRSENEAATLTDPLESQPGRARFANSSEAEFARILDFYRIDWQYEPRSFVLRRAEDGRLLECFTPDFYLPEFDLFVEITTLRQRLVTKKNHKVRLLRALYPEIKVKLFYGKDIRVLFDKYGVDVPATATDTAAEAVHA